MTRDVIGRMQAALDAHAPLGARAGTIDPKGEPMRVVRQTMRCAIADAVIRRDRLFADVLRAMVADGRRFNAATRRAAAADPLIVSQDAFIASLRAGLAVLPDPESI